MDNTLYSQHLEDGKRDDVQDASGQGTRQGEGYEGGEVGRSDKYEDKGAGLSAKKKNEGAGRNKVVRRTKRGGRRATRGVKVNLGGEQRNLYCNRGSNITIITPEMYKESMGKVVAARWYLRARGTTECLDNKGMFKTTLTTASGATKRTWVYVVEGARPGPCLGDHDAEDLGISYNPEGLATQEGEDYEDAHNVSGPTRHRQTVKKTITERPPGHRVETEGKEEANRIVGGYKGPVFTDRTGRKEDNYIGDSYQGEEGRGPGARERGRGAGLGELVLGRTAGLGAKVQNLEAGPGDTVQDEGEGRIVAMEDEGAGLIDVVEDETGAMTKAKTDIGDSKAGTNRGDTLQDRNGGGVTTKAGTDNGDSKDVTNPGRFAFNPGRQTTSYNTKQGHDHKEDRTYEEVTAPLRKLLTKGAVFRWDGESAPASRP